MYICPDNNTVKFNKRKKSVCCLKQLSQLRVETSCVKFYTYKWRQMSEYAILIKEADCFFLWQRKPWPPAIYLVEQPWSISTVEQSLNSLRLSFEAFNQGLPSLLSVENLSSKTAKSFWSKSLTNYCQSRKLVLS